jgi:hypothetical protein
MLLLYPGELYRLLGASSYMYLLLCFIGYQFGAKFRLVFCAKYDSGLDLGFWKILKPLKWTNIASFFLIKTNG